MAKTILVTGGAGFIGSCFVEQQIASGRHVIVLDALTYAGNEANLKHLPLPSFQFVRGDIRDRVLMSDLLEKHCPEWVVNFAAESHVDNSITGPAAFIDTNITGVYTMLEAALGYWKALEGDRQRDFRFLQISTDEVYGSLGPTGAFNEETPMRPNSPYSASKAAGDHLARAWHMTYGLPVITTNCTNNYGPRQYPEKLIPLIITRALSGEPLPVYGDGLQVRDWIEVSDHCRGIALALEKGKLGATYCFGGRAEKCNIDLVKLLCTILDEMKPRADGKSYREQIAFVTDRPGHDVRYAMDDSKAERELGFTRRYDFERGIRATVEWYLTNAEWCETLTGKTLR